MVEGFPFPIRTPEMVELLEKTVRSNEHIRQQYVNLLRQRRKLVKKPTFAFLDLYKDKALVDYNYSGRCNFSGVRKMAMKNYWIFVDCVNGMLQNVKQSKRYATMCFYSAEAWGDRYTVEEIRQHICSAITLINNRKRGARFRTKRKILHSKN